MSEITANIIVEPIDLTVTSAQTDLNVTVEPTQLNIYTSIAPSSNPGGNIGEIQYNLNGVLFGGTAGFSYDQVNGNVSIPASLNAIDVVSANGLKIGSSALTTGTANIFGTLNVEDGGISPGLFTANTANVTSLNVDGGTTSIQQAKEKVKIDAIGSGGTVDFDLSNQAIVIDTTNATSNFTLNFRGNVTTTLDSIMSANESMTCTYVSTNGAVPYVLTGASIDGNVQTVEYYNNNSPTTGTSNQRDFYTFNIIKTAGNTFLVFGATGNIV